MKDSIWKRTGNYIYANVGIELTCKTCDFKHSTTCYGTLMNRRIPDCPPCDVVRIKGVIADKINDREFIQLTPYVDYKTEIKLKCKICDTLKTVFPSDLTGTKSCYFRCAICHPKKLIAFNY